MPSEVIGISGSSINQMKSPEFGYIYIATTTNIPYGSAYQCITHTLRLDPGCIILLVVIGGVGVGVGVS